MERIKITVPDNWSDITIEQYQQFTRLMESKKRDKTKMIEGVSILCNMEKSMVKRVAINDLEKVYSILMDMTKDEPSNVPLEKNVTYKNIKYGVIPNMSEMTTGEFIDLETYCVSGMTENLHKVMSILYRPLIEKPDLFGRYNVEKYNPSDEKKNNFLDFPMNYALGVISFFFHLGEKLMIDSHNYLEKLKSSKTKGNKTKGE